MNTKTLVSKQAQLASPYQWEDMAVKNSLRFDSNTLPFPPPSINRFISDMKSYCPINEYADPTYKKLKELLSAYEKIPPSGITITNSGDEAIDILAKSFLNPGDYFVTTPPTYEMFSIQCQINRGKNFEVPLQGISFEVNAKAIIQIAQRAQTKMVFLVNPNNPTGSTIPLETIEKIVKQSNCVVVVDQAYGEFCGKTAIPLVKKYKNLVILKSFSKFAGLAGARIGYLIANTSLSTTFDTIRFPMGVSYLSYKLAETVLANDQAWMKKQVVMIKRERERLTQALRELGFFVYPSEANFLLVDMGNNASTIYKKLKSMGILVRDRSSKPYVKGCVRITIRSAIENATLITALKKVKQDIQKIKFAFLDRDGTLIFEPQDTYQIDSVKQLRVLDGVIKGLKLLMQQGYSLVMVTNQDGLGTTNYPLSSFETVQKKLLNIFRNNGISFTQVYVCPHLPKEKCDCRKPKLGLVKTIISGGVIDTSASFVCGDRKSDEQFAKNLDVRFVPMKTNGNFYVALEKKVRLQ